jgi:putative effector of murein hydrolase
MNYSGDKPSLTAVLVISTGVIGAVMGRRFSAVIRDGGILGYGTDGV